MFIATDWKEENVIEPIATMKCSINGKNYTYKIFQEDNGDFSLGIKEDDIIPLSLVDYSSKDSIVESIENYYKVNGGMCP